MDGAATGTVLFLGHETSAESREAYWHLRRTAGAGVNVRWLLDIARAPPIPADIAAEVETYDSRQFAQWGFATFGSTMLPGHCHFPVLRYFQQHRGIAHLWLVEYDVRFTGAWRDFFAYYTASDADLLTCHVRTERQEPGWHWWRSLRGPDGAAVAPGSSLRSLLVVARYSARALGRLIELQCAGWRGHQEVLVPTLLARDGLIVRDLNDSVASSARRRFYTTSTSRKGKLKGFGTVRYRPARQRPGCRRNMLYHPVKPPAGSATPLRPWAATSKLGIWYRYKLPKKLRYTGADWGTRAVMLARSLAGRRAASEPRFLLTRYGVRMRENWRDLTFQLCYFAAYGRFLSGYLERRDRPFVFLDVGANQGLYSLVAARNPHCHAVIALEPVAATFGLLQANARANGVADKLRPLNVGLAAQAGKAGIAMRAAHSGAATLSPAANFSPDGTEEVELVDMRQLDEALPDGIEIIVKVDVEGYEPVVLTELAKSRHIGRMRAVFYEVDENWCDPVLLRATLEAAGFDRFSRLDAGKHYDVLAERSGVLADALRDA